MFAVEKCCFICTYLGS